MGINMGTRSGIGFACKVELAKQVDDLFPWIQEDSEAFYRKAGIGCLFYLAGVRWNKLDPKVTELYIWLETQNEDDYLLIEVSDDYPSFDDFDCGEWTDNPWNLRRVIRSAIDFAET